LNIAMACLRVTNPSGFRASNLPRALGGDSLDQLDRIDHGAPAGGLGHPNPVLRKNRAPSPGALMQQGGLHPEAARGLLLRQPTGRRKLRRARAVARERWSLSVVVDGRIHILNIGHSRACDQSQPTTRNELTSDF